MNMKKLAFAFVAIAAVMLGAGCIGGGPVATPLPTVIEAPTTTIGTSEPTPTPTWVPSTQVPMPEGQGNAIFERLMNDMYVDIGSSMGTLGKHLTNGDLILADGAAKHLGTLAGIYIEEFEPCIVSKELETTKGLIIQGLKQTELASESCQAAIKTSNKDDVQRTADQLDNAHICFEGAKLAFELAKKEG